MIQHPDRARCVTRAACRWTPNMNVSRTPQAHIYGATHTKCDCIYKAHMIVSCIHVWCVGRNRSCLKCERSSSKSLKSGLSFASVCVCVCVYVCVRVCPLSAPRTRTYTCTHTHARMNRNTRTRTCTHTHTHARIHRDTWRERERERDRDRHRHTDTHTGTQAHRHTRTIWERKRARERGNMIFSLLVRERTVGAA